MATWIDYSPGGLLQSQITLNGSGELTYQVLSSSGGIIIDESRLGLKTANVDFYAGMTFVSTSTAAVNTSYNPPSGKKTTYYDHYSLRELAVACEGEELTIHFRLYDDGITFRYLINGTGTLEIEEEYSEFNLLGVTDSWGASWTPDYESEYEHIAPENLTNPQITMPFLSRVTSNGDVYWVLLTEGDVYGAAYTYDSGANYCVSILDGTGAPKLKMVFAPQQETNISAVYPFQTPQRIAIIAPDLDTLVNSTIVENSNPECAIADTSWIKPGRAAWSWWSEEFFEGVQHSMTRQKQYVDFAESMGLEYVTVDAGWVPWTDGSIAELCDYADSKGVSIFIWANGQIYLKPEYETPDNSYFADNYIDQDTGEPVHHIEMWSGWGIKGIKVDFMMDDSQTQMRRYQNIINLCNEFGLMVNFHGSTKPCGENRTWPNVITSEGVRGMEHYLGWFPKPTPNLFCIQPFIRNVVGPMDATPVALSNANKNTSQAHQLALAIIFQSGIQHFADSIDVYRAWKGTEFMRLIPASWDETRLIDGYPGDYVIMARRKGVDWFIGIITNAARTIQLTLPFIGEGVHPAYIYSDGETIEYLNKEQYNIFSYSVLNLSLLEGGGCAIFVSDLRVPFLPGDGYTIYEAESSGNTISGSAYVSDNANCSNGQKVGYLGNNDGTLTINNIYIPAGQSGQYSFSIHYLTADKRSITYKINNGPEVIPSLLPSGSFNVVRIYETTIELNEGVNTIFFSHNEWAVDIDCIGIKKL
ncbi:MAG: glycoside hydrolase family 97 catalytic domain-containing protein [Clostridiales bacterium]|nr:glycoside hydrolase family 97 catalytic domain-containing protein [Clostridiales bacterium]